MANTLNTQNSDHITMKYEQLLFSVLGGIRLEGLDRLRVTVKIEFKQQAIRHNLDLYNDTQADKLIRKTAERLEIGTSYISKAIGQLINELENYRLEEIQKQAVKQETRKVLTAEEKQAAIEFLKQPELLKRTNEIIGKAGVIGEELNRLLMFLIFTSRKTYRPLHIVSFGSSGVGKSHLQEKVGELIPQEEKIEITSLTGNAFYYFDKDELGHKLVLIEDLDGALAALYPIRELQSKQKISKTVTIKDKKGNAKTIHLVVYGPVCIAGCTTQERIYEDNANRSFLIYLDESEEQDEKVMQYQRLLSAGKINSYEEKKVKEFMQNVQRVLQPVTIRNPYAEYLKIPKEVFKPRRTNAHYIAFIEAITFYNQYQREQKADEETGELYIQTTLEDIAEANALMKHILLRKSDELNGACRAFFENLKQHLKAHNQQKFTNKEIRSAFRINHNTQKMFMVELQQYGYIRKTEGDKKKGFNYEVISFEEYEQLETRINTVLDQILQQLKGTEVEKLEEVVKKNQPLKTAPTKGKKAKTKEVAEK
ncbi:MAG: hypothetical protein H0V01_04495 [Bacteroidetes bacterium]|nr:hypothetical protein [Bacteroidota bacterium]HET6243911.1 hypothetical protein [Bacteroidia bacterium]